MSRSLLLLAALVLAPVVAEAGTSKAWTAAKKTHPDAPIIAGIDVASAKSSESFKKFFPMLLAKKPEAQEVLDRLQKECGFDPFVAINSVVAVIDDKSDNKGAFYIALKGWNATKIGACAQKIAKSEKKEMKLGPIKKGIQEVEMVGKNEKIYLGWIGKDVLVLATDPTDRTFVESVMRGKGKSDAGKLVNKLDTSATAWMAVIKEQSIQNGIDMKAVYGTVKIVKATLTADARIVTGDVKQATDLVAAFNKEMPNVQAQLPAPAQSITKALKVKSAGAEVQATTSAPEKDVVDLLSLVMMMM